MGAIMAGLLRKRQKSPMDAWDAERMDRNTQFEVKMIELAVAGLRRTPNIEGINKVRSSLNHLEKMMRSGDAASSDQEQRHA